jgi:hypothetical protein
MVKRNPWGGGGECDIIRSVGNNVWGVIAYGLGGMAKMEVSDLQMRHTT